MSAVGILQRLHAHRAWVNRNIIQCVKALTHDQLHQRFDIGQGSIWKTLCHLLAAEYVWLAALKGNTNPTMPGDIPDKRPGNQEADGALSSLAELIEVWQRVDVDWSDYLANLNEDELDNLVYKTSTSSYAGQTIGAKRSDVLLHVCTHAQYTVAQLINMFRHLGVKEFPEVMLISLARSEQLEKNV